MADAKALTDIATSYTILQGGDLFGVERSGTVGKFTWNSFQTQNATLSGAITFTGTVDLSGATISGAASFAALSASGVFSVASDIQHIGDTDNKIAFTTDAQSFETGGASRLDISDSGVRFGGANARVTTILDEDAMGSNSATALATQQSIKAYVDARVGGGFTFIETTDFSNDANYEFTAFGAYDAYVFVLQNVIPATDAANLNMRVSTDGGATFDSGANEYSWGSTVANHSTGTASFNSANSTTIAPFESAGSDAGELGISGEIKLFSPHLTSATQFTWSLVGENSSAVFATYTGGGARKAASVVNGVQIQFSSGNIESGTITVYGLSNS